MWLLKLTPQNNSSKSVKLKPEDFEEADKTNIASKCTGYRHIYFEDWFKMNILIFSIFSKFLIF